MLVKPKLILKRGDKPRGPTEPPVRVLKPETVMTMRMMMEGVHMNPRGTAHSTARLDGYTSAGKTGTAQIFDSQTHHYTHFYNASFMGFTPVTNPETRDCGHGQSPEVRLTVTTITSRRVGHGRKAHETMRYRSACNGASGSIEDLRRAGLAR